ncbi:MAG TPA: hypothetical protein VI039_13305 [Solirubrobacterales bacterium]
MNMLKKGPELKLSEIKVPGFLKDIYCDLRDRHLLPLVVLLAVAVVAVPILISDDSNLESLPSEATAPTTDSENTSKLIVAKAAPGLREYKQRFQGQVARNPFKQQYGEDEGKAAGSGSDAPQEATIETSTGGSEPAPVSGGDEGGGGEGGAPTEDPDRDKLTYYSWAIDVSVASGTSGENKGEPTVRRNQPQYTSLPSQKVPALTFIGVTKDEKRALMLVSDKVTGLFGEGVCVQGTERCQLVALEPGFPVTVVYGADSRTYRIELRKIRLVTTDKLNQAPLGKKGKKKKQQAGRAKSSSSAQRPILPPSADVDLDQPIAGE